MIWHFHQWRYHTVVDSEWPLMYGHTERRCTICGANPGHEGGRPGRKVGDPRAEGHRVINMWNRAVALTCMLLFLVGTALITGGFVALQAGNLFLAPAGWWFGGTTLLLIMYVPSTTQEEVTHE